MFPPHPLFRYTGRLRKAGKLIQMRVKKKIKLISIVFTSILLLVFALFTKAATSSSAICLDTGTTHSLAEFEIAKQLGWVISDENRCGGYYLEPAFHYPKSVSNNNPINVTSDQVLFSTHGTSILKGNVTITRDGQQIIANKAYLYRDPKTGKISSIDLIDHVILREPNSLILANCGHYDIKTHAKSLKGILYRTAVYNKSSTKPTSLSAWGQASKFIQAQPEIKELQSASYSTCPPTSIPAWQVRGDQIILNKITGRGTATDGELLVKGVPILYAPYLNFPIDKRRQTGFLFPTIGTSSKSGAYLGMPFYWNLAPNYDTTITPTYLAKRNLELADLFRYLTPLSSGEINVAILPGDKLFSDFKTTSLEENQQATNPTTVAELHRLNNASTTRKSISWQDDTTYNDHWTSDIDYNYVSDDYYLRDLRNSLNEVTQNQLLQQAEVNYKGQNWHLLGRVQQYQTLHPFDEPTVNNVYSHFPELAFEGDYPHQAYGLDYFVSGDGTHFDIRNTPGTNQLPMGNRSNLQPGISLPFMQPYLYFTPRLQFILTQYDLGHVTSNNQKNITRGIPIFDISSGLYFDRNIDLFSHAYRQTLEPQVYYTYVPFRNQDQIPLFDTTLNTLTYDELFTYNRFSGIDRIGDANQVSFGVTTRFIDEQSGEQKVQAGIGQIAYFESRRVTLCTENNTINCTDTPSNPLNTQRFSPISGVLIYNINPNWSATGNAIWNVRSNRTDNATVGLQYKPDAKRIINLGYSFVRDGDQLPTDTLGSSASNLRTTDLSFAWPITRDWSTVGRWSQNWNHRHFQDLLYGLQYDSCCWAVRFVAGRAFTSLNSNNVFQYNTQFFVQFALKGLGNVSPGGDPTQVLSSSIPGYENNFGQDF